MKKIIWISVLLLVGAGFFYLKYFTMLLDSKDSAIIVNKSYAFQEDYQDKRKLANAVDNIFIGEVIREEDHRTKKNTQFLVRITQNIKGALLGDITVNQKGGYYKKNGKLYLLSYEKTPLLKKGEMYLFAVSKTKKGYYTMLPKYGSTLLDNEDAKLKLIDKYRKVLEDN
ncbi:hypothetical protein [Neobacillus sp. LXY-1]|uniref:hypothetical protein n=1 Tax=Neobacillus sp. LXY-1 TaxID=3379133 RepID=UPI003EDEFDC2